MVPPIGSQGAAVQPAAVSFEDDERITWWLSAHPRSNAHMFQARRPYIIRGVDRDVKSEE